MVEVQVVLRVDVLRVLPEEVMQWLRILGWHEEVHHLVRVTLLQLEAEVLMLCPLPLQNI